MEKITAYEKLIGDIKKDLNKLEVEVDAIPDITPVNLLFNLLQYNLFKPSQIKELYSRLDKLKAKAQNGLEYYEIAVKKTIIESEIDVDNIQEISENQEINIDSKVAINQQGNVSQEEEKKVDLEKYKYQEISAIADNYFSQLVDLLTDINLLEKRLHQKDTQKFSFG